MNPSRSEADRTSPGLAPARSTGSGNRPGRCCAALLTGLAMLAVLASCVTESPRPRPAPSGATPAQLPPGPIARPADTQSTSSSHVRVAIQPIGIVPYDGMTLPLVSPDGKFLAVQHGAAPSWLTLLAQPGATVPATTRLAVYDISISPPRLIAPVEPLPHGLILGRSCDPHGFLVESPRPNSSRWLGKIAWVSGSLTWLVQGEDVNAHAVELPSGALAFTRRPVASMDAALILRSPDGRETARTQPNAAYACPVCTTDPGVVYALLRSAIGTEIEAIALDSTDSGTRFGSTIARTVLSTSNDAALAFQITVPCQNALAPKPAGEDDRVAIFHPGFARMATFDPATGGFRLLAAQSIAAARWTGTPDGYFCTAPAGLVFSALQTDPDASVSEVRVLADPLLARITENPNRPLVLVGPAGRDRTRLTIMGLQLAGQPGTPTP